MQTFDRIGSRYVFCAALAASGLFALSPSRTALPKVGNVDVNTIISRSVEANQRDWEADPEYSYSETTRDAKGVRTYQVTMLFGSPYQRLVRENGQPLSADQQKREQEKFDQAVAQRRSESPEARARRIAGYQRDRRRDHLMMEQLTKAFDFQAEGQKRLSGRSVYVLQATPRKGYQPPNNEARVLTGMRGTLWIDKATFQWVRVQARVISPVSIEGFLARVEPGTYFELEKMPVAGQIWLPKHFSMRAHAKVVGVFGHNTHEDDTYFDYKKTPAEYQVKSGG